MKRLLIFITLTVLKFFLTKSFSLVNSQNVVDKIDSCCRTLVCKKKIEHSHQKKKINHISKIVKYCSITAKQILLSSILQKKTP